MPAQAAPVITAVELTSLSDDTMIITWTTTNEASSTELLWGAGGLTNITTVSGTSKYHYVELNDLYQNTTYQYRVKSGETTYPSSPSYSPATFTTLEQPSGSYLFSFAVLNDLRYAPSRPNTSGSRGIAYQLGNNIVSSEVAAINSHDVAFTVINGNLADYDQDPGDQVTYNNQISSEVKGLLENLEGADDLPTTSYKYLPTPGYHDKLATYAGPANDWLSYGMLPLTTDPGTTESRYSSLYGYSPASRSADSIFNYQFKYNYYNFIFLDTVKSNGAGNANLDFLYNNLSAESNSKTFIFSCFPAYDLANIDGEKDYPLDIPTEELGVIKLANHEAFRATIEAFEDITGNPIVASVISSHLGDNYQRDINGISYIRQGPAIQYPTGYSIYKVYSTGFVKTFYKTTGGSLEGDGDTKPYYEYARDQISMEVVGGMPIPQDALTQFWLGTLSSRNFSYTYDFIPGISPIILSTTPGSDEASVNLNSPLLFTFNKRMSELSLEEWITIKNSSNESVSVTSANFVDTSKTILQVSHADFISNEVYTITVNAAKAKDEGLTPLATDYVFTFDTLNAIIDDEPPTVTITPLPDNSTIDPFPNFIGIATDESRVITVHYRFDNTGDWTTGEAVDGKFTGSTEAFQILSTSPFSVGSHQIWLKASDGAGNITTGEGFLAYTFTVVVGERPTTTSFKINERNIYSGDPIATTPKIEITITSNNSLESGNISIDSTTSPLSFVKVDTNYYATHEVTSALADGTHSITIEAIDIYANSTSYSVYPLYVQSASDTTIQGVPLNYPNPFDPGAETTAIGYTLSKASDITINFFDLGGNLISKKTYTSEQTGGKAGYNEITWDGKSDNGSYLGNGIYIYLIIADGKVIQNGKGKITVFKQ